MSSYEWFWAGNINSDPGTGWGWMFSKEKIKQIQIVVPKCQFFRTLLTENVPML